MIDLSCLQHFLVVARQPSLAAAAEELCLTPSAISKSLRRLETQLATTLFDREGRALRLNSDGQRLLEKAVPLLAAASQLHADFAGEPDSFKCRLVGPALLQLRWGQQLATHLAECHPLAAISFDVMDESAALAAVLSGDADLALVTLTEGGRPDARLSTRPLGETEFRVALGARHPLAGAVSAPLATVLQQDFVAPIHPPFASLDGEPATDGWRDDLFPRKIRYRSDDALLTRELLANGRALAYLPDYLIASLGLAILSIPDCPYRCHQQVMLVRRRQPAASWIAPFADSAAFTPAPALACSDTNGPR
ncbi:LysR family transcriptional regulator [Crenobacter sp. SG2305]|uniref:LysR family transcriptional regulator n=1 Tax=Crenobacter oryzisoli TaxID=3056844 RepID=UPI0025AAAAB8|nr:LysR family transcriptional regulator [Crenobacter sp. SG2305]MDN0083427.1 LysR family transcriptional regulator [Crenobacter sp. SG2305]